MIRRHLALIGLMLVLGACDRTTAPTVTSVSINPRPPSVLVGETVTLEAIVDGSNNPGQGVTWMSSDPVIASVSSSGVVSALRPGNVSITATSVTDPTRSDRLETRVVANDADYEAFNASLPTWAEFSPLAADEQVSLGAPELFTELFEGETYQCTREAFSLTTTPERIVTLDPDKDALWVGGLLQGTGHRAGIGSLRELPIRQRAPLIVYVDRIGPNISRVVENPNGASVQQAISDIIIELQESGIPLGSDIAFDAKRTHSVEQAAFEMGLSARYMGNAVRSKLETTHSVDETIYTAHFYQRLFTITMVRPPTPGGFFSDEFTQDRLDEQTRLGTLGPDNLPVYVASISYGRVLHFSLVSKASEGEIVAALNASYSGASGGVSAELTSEQRKLLAEARISIASLGGDQDQALRLIRSGDLYQYFEKAAPLTTAEPISYQIRNLGDGSTALVSETTTYNLENCARQPKRVELQFDERVGCMTPGQTSIWGSRSRCDDPPGGGWYKRTLAANEWYEARTFTRRIESANGHATCDFRFSDEVDGGKVSIDPHRKYRTIEWKAHSLSPSGASSGRGWVDCRITGKVIRME